MGLSVITFGNLGMMCVGIASSLSPVFFSDTSSTRHARATRLSCARMSSSILSTGIVGEAAIAWRKFCLSKIEKRPSVARHTMSFSPSVPVETSVKRIRSLGFCSAISPPPSPFLESFWGSSINPERILTFPFCFRIQVISPANARWSVSPYITPSAKPLLFTKSSSPSFSRFEMMLLHFRRIPSNTSSRSRLRSW